MKCYFIIYFHANCFYDIHDCLTVKNAFQHSFAPAEEIINRLVFFSTPLLLNMQINIVQEVHTKNSAALDWSHDKWQSAIKWHLKKVTSKHL